MITYACTQDTKILKESNNDKKIIDNIIVDFVKYKILCELYFLTRYCLEFHYIKCHF